jgi:hypothetical protein
MRQCWLRNLTDVQEPELSLHLDSAEANAPSNAAEEKYSTDFIWHN